MEVGQDAYREAGVMLKGILLYPTGLEAVEVGQEACREAGVMVERLPDLSNRNGGQGVQAGGYHEVCVMVESSQIPLTGLEAEEFRQELTVRGFSDLSNRIGGRGVQAGGQP